MKPRPIDPLSIRVNDTIRVTNKIGSVTVMSVGKITRITDPTPTGWVTYISAGVALYRRHSQLGCVVPGGSPVQLIELVEAAPETQTELF